MRLQFPRKAIKAHTERLVRHPKPAGTRSPRSPLRTHTLRGRRQRGNGMIFI